ncbi:MAG: VCBS repeat-containing protein, partial [Actinobacteria bacterium]|nr:VCBS repeat-containing protein [Actinomycetota bacterium]
DLDLVVGNDAGAFAYFANTGTATSPAFAALTGAANPLDGFVVGNRSAPALGDLDRDGDLDLVIGDLGGGFHYFANTGTAIAPAFAAQTGAANPLDGFSAVAASKPALGDLDRDGDLDLVAGLWDGTFRIYENTGTAVTPSFVERTGAANPLAGQQLQNRSAPSLGDLDGDGDLDLVVGSSPGTFVALRNLHSPDALPQFAGNSVGAPALGDLDGDGDLDLVSESAQVFHYFENTSSGGFAVFVQRTGAANPFDGAPLPSVASCRFPALVDLDGDDDLDLVSGQYHEFCYFENTGTAMDPGFVQRTGTANPLDGLELSAGFPRPAFGDLDADGDLDLISGYGYGNQIIYFENTGSTTHAAFVRRFGPANPFPVYPDYSSYYVSPTLGDLDGDGDLDCVAGNYTGRFEYLENTGTPASPAFVSRAGPENPLSPFGPWSHPPRPALGDLEGDGDLDLVADVFLSGKMVTFENTGLPNLPAFIQRPASDPISDLNLYQGAAAFADLDRDGDVDFVTGSRRFFENTSTGLVPAFVERTGADNPLPMDIIYRATPAFADLDADGDVDLLSGSRGAPLGSPGLLYYLENTGDATSPQFAAPIPNPFGLSNPSGFDGE